METYRGKGGRGALCCIAKAGVIVVALADLGRQGSRLCEVVEVAQRERELYRGLHLYLQG